ncbi:MAG: ATP-dependent 6-phosphofructokinase [Clostridia bacterium]|nr:ATP-dependent 6-phosphofructokinase [Clostridia bacterium]
MKKIGVLTSGGDAPGMNAVIRAVTDKAIDEGIEVVGIVGGYRGLIDNNIRRLDYQFISDIIGIGGTRLYSDRCKEFQTEEGMQKAVETCRINNIDAIIAIGGDGTFRGATDLTLHGVPTIGVTGTIDNDITATDYTVGFDTAMNTVLASLDKIKDTCESHARLAVVEVMGRDCGQIALMTGIAAGAIAVVIPEIEFDEDAALERILSARQKGKRGMVVVVSEGVYHTDENGNRIHYGEYFAKKVSEVTEIDVRFMRLGHLVRGGHPSLRDRLTASLMGVKAVELLIEGKSNIVVVEEDGRYVPMDIVFALTTDRMYKNKLQPGDLDRYNSTELDIMKAICDKRATEIKELYDVANSIAM